MQKQNKILVVGGGSWATANIKMLTDNITPKEIFWWMRNAEAVEHIHKFGHNPKYLSSVEIKVVSENISSNLHELITGVDMVLLNVPAAFLKEALADISAEDLKGKATEAYDTARQKGSEMIDTLTGAAVQFQNDFEGLGSSKPNVRH